MCAHTINQFYLQQFFLKIFKIYIYQAIDSKRHQIPRSLEPPIARRELHAARAADGSASLF